MHYFIVLFHILDILGIPADSFLFQFCIFFPNLGFLFFQTWRSNAKLFVVLLCLFISLDYFLDIEFEFFNFFIQCSVCILLVSDGSPKFFHHYFIRLQILPESNSFRTFVIPLILVCFNCLLKLFVLLEQRLFLRLKKLWLFAPLLNHKFKFFVFQLYLCFLWEDFMLVLLHYFHLFFEHLYFLL